MSYRPINSKTRARQARYRAALRRWKPRIRELCPAAPAQRIKQPSATKKGPGRRHVQGYSKRLGRVKYRAEGAL